MVASADLPGRALRGPGAGFISLRFHGRSHPRAARLRPRHPGQRTHLLVRADGPHPGRRPRARPGLWQRRHRALPGRARWHRRRPHRRPDHQRRRSRPGRPHLPPGRSGRPRRRPPAAAVCARRLRRHRLCRRAGAHPPVAARAGRVPRAAGARRPPAAVDPQRRLQRPRGRIDGGRVPLPHRRPARRNPRAFLYPAHAAALPGRARLGRGMHRGHHPPAARLRIQGRLRRPAARRGAPPAGAARRANLPVHRGGAPGAGR